jgi:hypothetical protein
MRNSPAGPTVAALFLMPSAAPLFLLGGTPLELDSCELCCLIANKYLLDALKA